MSMQKLIESRMSSMKSERTRLAESWNPYIQSVENYMAKQGKTLNEMDKMNIARCLENALMEGGVKSQSKLFNKNLTNVFYVSYMNFRMPILFLRMPFLIKLYKIIVQRRLKKLRKNKQKKITY